MADVKWAIVGVRVVATQRDNERMAPAPAQHWGHCIAVAFDIQRTLLEELWPKCGYFYAATICRQGIAAQRSAELMVRGYASFAALFLRTIKIHGDDYDANIFQFVRAYRAGR